MSKIWETTKTKEKRTSEFKLREFTEYWAKIKNKNWKQAVIPAITYIIIITEIKLISKNKKSNNFEEFQKLGMHEPRNFGTIHYITRLKHIPPFFSLSTRTD